MGGGASKRPVTAPSSGQMAPQSQSQPPKHGSHVIGRHVSFDSRAMPMSMSQGPFYTRPSFPAAKQVQPPQPPRSAKEDVYSVKKYGLEVDKHVAEAPLKLLIGSCEELVLYLTQSHYHWDDLCRVRALFLWVATVDVYGLGSQGDQAPARSPLEYLSRIRANTGNHASLMHYLCQLAGIPSIIITGMNKSAVYEPGDRCDRKKMAAHWNAVHVNGDWRFLDAFWASACVVGRKTGDWTLVDNDGNVTKQEEETSEGLAQHRLNEFFFLPDPDKLISTHFPDDPQWQLLQTPITATDFEERVYIREGFHQTGMKLLPDSKDKVLLESVDGEIDLVFALNANENGAASKFMYMLFFGSKKEKDKIKEENDENGEEKDDAEPNIPLHRFVMFEQTADRLRFSLRFPIKGKFKMDILGCVPSGSCFEIACVYVITCKEPKKSCLPLPDAPDIGWGPGEATKEAGLKPITHDGAIIMSKDGNVEIRLAADKNIQLHQMLRHALIDDATLSNYAVTRLENGEAIVNIRLPQGGEYALKLYADDVGTEGMAPNVLNYLIKAEGKNINNVPFPNVSGGALSKKPAADALGVEASSHKGGTVNVKNGRERVEFRAPGHIMMMAELHTADHRACKNMMVKPVEKNGKWSFRIDLPEKGEYSLNVFACDKDGRDRIYNVHSYMVNSDGWDEDEEDKEEGETGAQPPAPENKPVVKQVPVETVQTSENEVLIPVPPGYEDVCASLYRRNANDPPDDSQVRVVEQDGIRLIRAALPEYGEYQLTLYDRDDKGVVRNVAKYQVNRRRPGELYEDNTKMLMQNLGAQQPLVEENSSMSDQGQDGEVNEEEDDEVENQAGVDPAEEEKRRATRRQIKKAIELKDVEMLRHYIAAYEKLAPSEGDKVLDRAKRTLAMLEAKEELVQACQKRDLEKLEKAIARAREANVDNRLDLQLAVAYKLRERLKKLAKLHHAVLNLDSKAIAEIKTYSNPPDGVQQSMMAMFILLGNTPKEVRVWKTCQALMGRTGRESLMRRISKFDPQDCSVSVARQARQALGEFSLGQIRDVSAGAATFFSWSLGIIEEVESTGGSGSSSSKKLK